jgi:SAM-dependent methyltransferase
MNAKGNVHGASVAGFGDEWQRFDQSELDPATHAALFGDYFGIFPEEALSSDARGADFGVGSGRWAMLVAPRVGELVCVDASAEALEVARANLAAHGNCRFVHASIEVSGIAPASLDFAYSLGVLHHLPDTLAGMRACVATLKPGAPFLVYLYYRFDNKPKWYAWLWRLSEAGRRLISKLPHRPRYWVSQLIAALVYWPLARAARLAEKLGADVGHFPLSYYRDKPFYVLRTDALDRFGTQLEQRFTKAEIAAMMAECGLTGISFSEGRPYWVAVGRRAA